MQEKAQGCIPLNLQRAQEVRGLSVAWLGGAGISLMNNGTYALIEEQRVPFDTKYGHNTLVIEGGKAHIEEADCPDHYCEQQGEISKTGETLVCLPHKLVAEVVAGEEADVDIVAK